MDQVPGEKLLPFIRYGQKVIIKSDMSIFLMHWSGLDCNVRGYGEGQFNCNFMGVFLKPNLYLEREFAGLWVRVESRTNWVSHRASMT